MDKRKVKILNQLKEEAERIEKFRNNFPNWDKYLHELEQKLLKNIIQQEGSDEYQRLQKSRVRDIIENLHWLLKDQPLEIISVDTVEWLVSDISSLVMWTDLRARHAEADKIFQQIMKLQPKSDERIKLVFDKLKAERDDAERALFKQKEMWIEERDRRIESERKNLRNPRVTVNRNRNVKKLRKPIGKQYLLKAIRAVPLKNGRRNRSAIAKIVRRDPETVESQSEQYGINIDSE